jgi:hypothetical protein
MTRNRFAGRGGALIGAGVLGTACTLFAGVAGLGYFKVAEAARAAIALWRSVTEDFWRLALGWIGIHIPPTITAFLSFLAFALAIAIGVRLRNRRQARDGVVAPDANRSVASLTRIALGTLMAVLGVPASVMSGEIVGYLVPSLIAYLNSAMLVAALAFAFAAFAWIHGTRPEFLEIGALGAGYSACAYASPMSDAVDKEIMLFNLGPLLWLLTLPAVVVAVFSVMLRIAEPVSLRNRLALSTVVAVVMFGVNAGLAAMRL